MDRTVLATALRRARPAAAALALLAPTSVPAQLVSEPAYVHGRDAWQQRLWAQAVDKLRPLVDPNDRANYEVDFWLGTSLCRLAGRVAQGANILDWSLSFRSMPEAARPAFAHEKKLCVDALREQRLTAPEPDRMGGASGPQATAVAMATVRGTPKLYIQGGSPAGNLALTPLRVIQPRTAAELESRLVPLGRPAEALRGLRQLAPQARFHVSRYAAIASVSPAHDARALQTLGLRVDEFVEFMKAAYSLEAPPTYITIHLYPGIPALRAAALKLHGMQANEATLGYSFSNDRSILAMLTGTAAGTLLHEVSHMLVHESFGAVPQWLDEGLASLYETATASSGLYFGEPNWRSPVFAHLKDRFRHISLRDVVTAPWFTDEPGIQHRLGERIYDLEEQAYLLAYARMFALYLQETGSLRKVFDAFRHRSTPDEYIPAKDRAVGLLEAALGKPLGQAEAEFMAWAPRAFNPEARFYAGGNRAELVRKELPVPARVDRELPKAAIERETIRP